MQIAASVVFFVSVIPWLGLVAVITMDGGSRAEPWFRSAKVILPLAATAIVLIGLVLLAPQLIRELVHRRAWHGTYPGPAASSGGTEERAGNPASPSPDDSAP